MPFRVRKPTGKLDTKVIFAKTLQLAVIPVQEKVAKTVKKEIKKIIKNENIIVTGKYYKSIQITKKATKDNLKIEVASVDVPYAKWLEWGTIYMKARHVFHRAILQANKRIKKYRKLKVKK